MRVDGGQRALPQIDLEILLNFGKETRLKDYFVQTYFGETEQRMDVDVSFPKENTISRTADFSHV